jgi:hypothetical protein
MHEVRLSHLMLVNLQFITPLMQFFGPPTRGPFLWVHQAWRVARKRNQLGCVGLAGDLEVKVLYIPGKGKC